MKKLPSSRSESRCGTTRPRPWRLLLLAIACLLCAALAPVRRGLRAEETAAQPVIINEILYAPALATEWVEFVELHSRSSRALDLSGWTLRGGIEFTIPPNTSIAPGGYLLIAQNPAALRAKYGVAALGPFRKLLSAQGETLDLRDNNASVADVVSYGFGFPWPIASGSTDRSIQLINPALDNRLPGAWRSAAPTPGAANSGMLVNPPPLISSVTHSPKSPRPDEAVVVSVHAQDTAGMAGVRLGYQVVLPGQYITLADAAYRSQWTWLPMAVDESGLYRVTIPPDVQQHRSLVRYRIEATDGEGRSVVVPYADDPQPNFAYFVYGEMPLWTASPTGEGEGAEIFDFGQVAPVPVYHFVAKQGDIADAFYIPPSALATGYMGNEYRWRGTLVYNGEVYDHVGFRARGGAFRYATGKAHWKIDFLPGHQFQARDDSGAPFSVLRDNLNLSAVMQRAWTKRRGEQGMFESATNRLFNMAGVAATKTNFVHLRVIDEAQETGPTQFDGDFWGLYLALEQPDGRFLQEHGLPDGNLYKIDIFGPERDNLGPQGPADGSDVHGLVAAYQDPATGPEWWRANVDLEGYYSYRAVIEFVRHYDIDANHNYYYYSNPETGKWSVLPWDVDLTWHNGAPGNGAEPFLALLLSKPEFQSEYQNRLRELRDLLFTPEQVYPLLEEIAARIDTPRDGPSMVDANRAMWDYNPILTSRYVSPNGWETRPGSFYEGVADGTFRAMVEQMKQYADERIRYIDTALLRDQDFPATPVIGYAGAEGFPADGIRFSTGAFADPQGAESFAAMEWRVAETLPPETPTAAESDPFLFEINAVWQSGELAEFGEQMSTPPGVLQPGRAYRARVRMKDNTGRWSHWSEPLIFVTAPPAQPVPADLVISEIMYHPAREANIPEEDLEFVEFHNRGTAALELGGMQLTQGVEYTFPSPTLLASGEYLVIAGARETFERVYGVAPYGAFARNLSNGGDTLALVDGWQRQVVAVAYDDAEPWPQGADGAGYSLVYNPLAGAPDDARAWRQSAQLGGSPGRYDPETVLVNELLLLPAEERAVELLNPGSQPVDVSHWFLGDTAGNPRQVWLPAGTVVPPGGMVVLGAELLATSSFDGPLNWFNTVPESLVLSSGDRTGGLTGYRQQVDYDPADPGVSIGRHVDSTGRAHFTALAQPTLGAPNAAPLAGPIVISALQYHPLTGDEYIELTNISAGPVALYDPAVPGRQWQLLGGFYTFPEGVELPPGGRLLVTSAAPTVTCESDAGRGYTRILGPFTRPLSDSGQAVILLRPVETPAGIRTGAVDRVEYSAALPWPPAAAGEGAALRRANPAAFGNDPIHWQADFGEPGEGMPPQQAPSLCAFSAVLDAPARQVRIAWWVETSATSRAYRLWRATSPNRDAAILVATRGGEGWESLPASDQFVDIAPDEGSLLYYWLEVVDSEGTVTPVGMTSLEQPWQHVLLPLLQHK